MNILIDDTDNWLDEKPSMLTIIQNVIKGVLEKEKFSEDVEVSITLTNNETIKKINFDHRNIDDVTDVISFPQIDWVDNGFDPDGYTNLVGEDIILGDIVISIDRLKEQAAEYGHSIERELGFLVAHSMFHLLGYDHKDIEEEQKMIKKQEQVLQKLGLVR